MANPARPASGDTIASAWARDVADTVVRRYATTAARDADLGAETNAALAGEVIWLDALKMIEAHTGAAWVTHAPGLVDLFDEQQHYSYTSADSPWYARDTVNGPHAVGTLGELTIMMTRTGGSAVTLNVTLSNAIRHLGGAATVAITLPAAAGTYTFALPIEWTVLASTGTVEVLNAGGASFTLVAPGYIAIRIRGRK